MLKAHMLLSLPLKATVIGCWEVSFLPPANEVWGKVMFLHLCVILFTGGRGWLTSQHASQVTWPGESASRGLQAGGGRQTRPLRYMGYYRIQARGTHPTGMLSFLWVNLQQFLIRFKLIFIDKSCKQNPFHSTMASN